MEAVFGGGAERLPCRLPRGHEGRHDYVPEPDANAAVDLPRPGQDALGGASPGITGPGQPIDRGCDCDDPGCVAYDHDRAVALPFGPTSLPGPAAVMDGPPDLPGGPTVSEAEGAEPVNAPAGQPDQTALIPVAEDFTQAIPAVTDCAGEATS